MTKEPGFRHIPSDNIVLDEKELFQIKGFDPTKGFQLFEVRSEKMCPTLLPKEVVIAQEISRIDNIKNNGHIILVSLEGLLQVKRVAFNKDPEMVLLLNDNPENPEIQRIKKSDLGKVLVIRGKISNSLVPDYEHISRKKIQELNYTLQDLKKEISLVNTRLRYLRIKLGKNPQMNEG